MIWSFVLFGSYLIGTVAVGLWASRKGRRTEEDYYLAGRGLSPVSMALSAVSSGRSAWLVVGASAAAWSLGLSAMWLFPGYVLAEALMFVTVGPRLRKRSEAVGAITIPEVLQKLGRGPDGREGTSRLPIRTVAALLTCAFLLTYVSAQLGAAAKTVGGIYSIDGSTSGLLVTSGIVAVYTVLGGYRAVVVTDVLQAVFMLIGMLVLPILGLISVGGPSAMMEGLRALDPALTDPVRSWLALLGGLAIGFGSPGNPHILVRHMSLGDTRQARVALLTGTSWNVVMAAGALATGLAGRVLYPTTDFLLGEGGEYLYATMADDLSRDYFFLGFEGLLLAALFAAVMSTCDSQLLVIASSLTRDFRRSRGEPGRSGILVSRLAVLATLGIAVALSYGNLPIVNDLVLLSWAALGAAFGPPLVVALYDGRTTARGMLAGMLVGGGGVVAAWFLWASPRGKAIDYELAVSFLAASLVTFALRDRVSARS